MYYKFLKFVYLIMQIRHDLIKYAQFCIYFRVDRSEHMIKQGANFFFFHLFYAQDGKKSLIT